MHEAVSGYLLFSMSFRYELCIMCMGEAVKPLVPRTLLTFAGRKPVHLILFIAVKTPTNLPVYKVLSYARIYLINVFLQIEQTQIRQLS